MVLLFWCRLTRVVLEKRPLNECSVVVVLDTTITVNVVKFYHVISDYVLADRQTSTFIIILRILPF